MNEADCTLIVRTVAATLRVVAGWMGTGPTPGGLDRDALYEVAEEVESLNPDWACCPVCEEMTCDPECPLDPIRSAAQARLAGQTPIVA